MKPKLKLNILLLVLLSLPALARAQGTAFSYQGHLAGNAAAANAGYDFIFALFGSAAGADLIVPAVPLNNVPVANGQFHVTLDFGATAFTGATRWLEISVRPAGIGLFTKMDARVSLLPTPYAIFAATAGSVPDAALTANQLNTGGVAPLAGQFLTYNGANLVWTDRGVAVGNIWSQVGADAYYNAGNVGIGGLAGTSKLQITGADALTLSAPGGPYLTWRDTTTGRNAAISSAGGTLYYRVPDAVGNVLTAGYVDSNGMVTRGRLSVEGFARIAPGGSGGTIQFGTPNGETGMTIVGANRADIRFDGSTLKLLAGPGVTSPGIGITVNTAGNVGIGTDIAQAKLDVRGTTRTCVLTITGGCDLAEPFPMDLDGTLEGSVVVIDDEHPGRVKPSDRAYDTRVAGILSGANGVNPGISLQQEGVLEGGQNVALSGRVYVLADATQAPIKPGDLLTTSYTPGRAMKVTDHAKAQGAILGKAMSTLKEGKGMVLVLVTLQ